MFDKFHESLIIFSSSQFIRLLTNGYSLPQLITFSHLKGPLRDEILIRTSNGDIKHEVRRNKVEISSNMRSERKKLVITSQYIKEIMNKFLRCAS